MNAPTGRNASVSVMARSIVGTRTENSLAMSVTTNTSRKKSNASSDQPRKHATKVLRAAGLSSARTPLNYVLFGEGEADGLPDGAGEADPDGDAEPDGDADGLADGAGVLFGGYVRPYITISQICPRLTVIFGTVKVKFTDESSALVLDFEYPAMNVSVRFAPLIVRGKVSL